MDRMRKIVKVISVSVVGIVVVCLLLLGIFRTLAKRSPEIYYHQGGKLKIEALEYLRNKDWNRALAKYKDALTKFQFIKEKYPQWRVEIISKEYAECQTKIDIADATLLSDLGFRYFKRGEFEDAIKVNKELLAKYEDKYGDRFQVNSAAWARLGVIYQSLGKYEDALNAYNIVLTKYKDYKHKYFRANAQFGIGYIYQSMGRYEEAKEAFQRLISEYEEYSAAKGVKLFLEILPIESWEQLGLGKPSPIIERFMWTDMANEEFLAAIIKIDKDFENLALAFIGLKLQIEGNLNEARKYYQKCISGSPNKDDAGYKLATAALQKLDEQIK